MTRILRSAILSRPVRHIYDLVADIPRYPERFDWCTGASVESVDEDTVLARLELRFGGIETRLVTRNRLLPSERIELRLIEGPFNRLGGQWTFTPLGSQGCRIGLELDFEIAGRYLGSVLAGGLRGLADRMVDDFVRAAHAELT